MSQPIDLSLFPDLPPEVVKAFAAMQFELSVERAARQHEQAVVAEKDGFITELQALIEKLEGQIQDYRRTKFGPKSEKLDPAQLELALEDLETAIAETQAQIAAVEEKIAASESDPEKRKPRAPARPVPCPKACRAWNAWLSPTALPAPAAAATWSGSGKTGLSGWTTSPRATRSLSRSAPNMPVPRGAQAWCKPKPLRISWRAAGPQSRCWPTSRCPSIPSSCL
jgi:transposase